MSNIKDLLEYSKTLNVLFIEDNTDVREQLSKLLNNFFDNIELSFNGIDAIEKYKKYKDTNNKFYDLIITDISMPKLDGIELSKEIFKLNENQQILVISAHTEKQKLNQLNEIGIDCILQKPVEHTSLINTLEKIINKTKEVN